MEKKVINIIILFGLVSMFADMTYEGARSVLPQYLEHLGADLAFIGFLGGLGEFISYLIRFASGSIASKYGFLWGLTISGYAITAISVGSLGLITSWFLVALLVVMERLGKGLRTPARDSLISMIASKGRSGRAFGIHGAIDQIGAIVGPAIAGYALVRYGFSSLLFIVLAIFSIVSVIILFYIRTIYPRDVEVIPKRIALKIVKGPISLYIFSVSLPILASVPLFVGIAWVSKANPVMGVIYFIAIQVIQTIMSLALGELYDRVGISAIYVYYLIVPLTVLGLIFSPYLLLLIGVILALEESIQRAIIGDLAKGNQSFAYGYYHLIYGLASLVGGYLVGLLAQQELFMLLFLLSITFSIAGALMMRITISKVGKS